MPRSPARHYAHSLTFSRDLAFEDIRYFVRSPKFAAEFSKVSGRHLFDCIKSRCHGRCGPIGDGEFEVPNDRGEKCEFCIETFFNGHEALSFGRRGLGS